MTWRDGVHLTGTPIWCDARRRRDVCFVSSADRVGKTGHGQLVGTPLTLALLGASSGGHLPVPLRRPFTLGTTRLELIDSARGPGAAALVVDTAGKTVLYAGAIRDGAEVRRCETLVVSAPIARAVPPLAKTIEQAIAWTKRELAAGRRPVLLVESVLDGLDVAMRLAEAGVALAGAKPIREAAQRAAASVAGIALPIAAPGKEPRAIVWIGARVPEGSVASLALDGDFPWVGAAGKRELLAWIESASAREVYVTGAAADDIVRALGPRARVIGPPHQMTLFEAMT